MLVVKIIICFFRFHDLKKKLCLSNMLSVAPPVWELFNANAEAREKNDERTDGVRNERTESPD